MLPRRIAPPQPLGLRPLLRRAVGKSLCDEYALGMAPSGRARGAVPRIVVFYTVRNSEARRSIGVQFDTPRIGQIRGRAVPSGAGRPVAALDSGGVGT